MTQLAARGTAPTARSPLRPLIIGFHAVVVAVAGFVLWSMSYPGSDIWQVALAAVAVLAVGVCWLAWLVIAAVTTRRLHWWLAITPAIGALTVALLVADVPLKVRWAAVHGAFDAVVAGHPIPPAGSAPEPFTVPKRIGTYTIPRAEWVPGGAVFFEANGAGFMDDGGFAYLPGGPSAELDTGVFEGPRFVPLGGGWYSFTGSS
ncbi:hypothetical protein [Dactylosporangium sp. CS-033363]|uniref:hypothetical protein n=1 Tax=Dactylosporangium sp. CS-033363 TaxID=3239935 RepID=UPI003D8DD1EB